MSENQETLQRCRRWLVNNLSVDNIECHLGEVLHTDSVQAIMVIFTIVRFIDAIVVLQKLELPFTINLLQWPHEVIAKATLIL